jgi:hypothetical protein
MWVPAACGKPLAPTVRHRSWPLSPMEHLLDGHGWVHRRLPKTFGDGHRRIAQLT